jgi:hypothetical protein
VDPTPTPQEQTARAEPDHMEIAWQFLLNQQTGYKCQDDDPLVEMLRADALESPEDAARVFCQYYGWHAASWPLRNYVREALLRAHGTTSHRHLEYTLQHVYARLVSVVALVLSRWRNRNHLLQIAERDYFGVAEAHRAWRTWRDDFPGSRH